MFNSVRSTCVVALGAALLLGGAVDAAAQGRGGGGGAPLTPQAYRVGIMQHFMANTQALTAVRAGTVGAPSHVLARATIVQQLASMLTDAFPAGSEGGRALPVVWTDRAGLTTRITALQTAANALVDAARAGNAEQIATAQMAVTAACGACHMAFRGPAQ